MPIGAVSYTSYTPGTTAWSSALEWDLSRGLISQAQYTYALQNPGMAVPSQIATTETSGWASFGKVIENTLNLAVSTWGKVTQMEYQKDMLQADIEARRLQIESGMPLTSPAGFGGINVWTLVAFGGIAVLAMILLKK